MPQLVALHLVPGLLTTLAWVLLAPPLMARGYPALFALLLATGGVLIPLELGYLLIQARQAGGRLRDLIQLRDPLPGRQLILWPLTLFVWGIASSILSAPADNATLGLFSWLPRWYFAGDIMKDLTAYSPQVLRTTFLLGFVIGGFAGPIVEELYFRGYLLPRMAQLGRWAPLVHAVLFSLYHFWTPWQNVSRIALMIPLTYLVWWKRNIYIGMIAHIALNAIVWGFTLGGLLRSP